MKAKTCFFWLIVWFFISIQIVYSQSIWFDSPTDGQTITNTTQNSETTVKIEFVVGAKASTNPLPNELYMSLYDQNGTLLGRKLVENIDYGTFYLASGFYPTLNWAPGTYHLYAYLSETWSAKHNDWVNTASAVITIHVKNTISVVNNFGAGSINVDNGTTISGAKAYKYIGDGLSVGAIDQPYNGTNYTWNIGSTSPSNWTRKTMTSSSFYNINGATARNYSYSVVSNDNGATISSDMRKIFNITFQNYMPGLGNTGVIEVNGTLGSSPSTNTVIQGDQITAIATAQIINGIFYTFSSWSAGSSYYCLTISPTADATTYTANFTGRPSLAAITVSFERIVGNPIKINWIDNPNSNVTYKIWRKIQGVEYLLATVGRGVQTYTDEDYQYTGNSNDKLVYYDVRQYYSTEGTYSDPNYISIYAKIGAKMASNDNNAKTSLVNENINNYTLEQNSPNPFNPSTIISYQLPNDGFVSLKVYDMLGREVKTLVNDIKTKGKYSVSFDASNLASGIYIYRLNANGFSSIKKMILTK